MKKNRMVRLLTAMLLSSAMAFASPLTLTLQNAVLGGGPGETLTFVGTASNTTAQTENLNSDSFTLQSPLTIDDSLYFNLWPLGLNSSQSFGPQSLFTISIPLSTPLGLYNGSFDILGGLGVNDQTVLATTVFQVNVVSGTTTPEPATGILFLVGVALIPLRRRYRR
jgi:hypothetical protein